MGMQKTDAEELQVVVEQLSGEKISQLLNFARFLWWQERKQLDQATPFEVWAEKLAQEKGFASLNEDQVAYIVHESRSEPE
jgi:hypothetical protein